jgi:alpha-mannosidase
MALSHSVRWTQEKITRRLELIEPLVYRQKLALPDFRYLELASPREDPPVSPAVSDADWEIIPTNTYWGRWNSNFVLRCRFSLPPAWQPAGRLALFLPLGEAGDFSHPEALAYVDGQPYAGCDRHHQEIPLHDAWRDGKEHLLALHGWTGLGGWHLPEPTQLFMRACYLVEIDMPLRDFIAHVRVGLDVAAHLEARHPAHDALLNALDEAFLCLDTREPLGEDFYASLPQAQKALQAGLRAAGSPLDADVIAAGHAHLDVAWLWTLDQTRQKAARTFHSVLRLMEQFPDWIFTQSQPQLYEFVRQDFPVLFEQIKARVAEGRWEATGGMWVEADCNLSGPESLARQLLLGRTYFRKQFGKGAESPVLWLPDVFGYAWNLPQLIRQAGLQYFFTIKIGWNQYNRLPYDSFWWQGLDGTRVLTHFSTTPNLNGEGAVSTYNAMVAPEQVLGTWENYQQKELRSDLFMAFGFGDGGGGPTHEMLENLEIMAAFPATPRIRPGTARAFFQALEAQVGDKLPVWDGELYLELHRGTYTSQSRNKRANRKSEFLLHDAEFLASLAARLSPEYSYPADDLREAWRTVCLNQFHDIIPGSSIGAVYTESLRQYAQVNENGEQIEKEAFAAIHAALGRPDMLLVNPTGFTRYDLAQWTGALPTGMHLVRADGRLVRTQACDELTLIDVSPGAAYSMTPLYLEPGDLPVPDDSLTATPSLLENGFLRVELDAQGDIVRIYDKANQREVLPLGMIANQLQAFEDRPVNWDAWDVDIFYEDRMWLSDPAGEVRVVQSGPLRATLEVRRRILHSDYVQRISLDANSARLDFETVIDWRERHILLKAAFPVDVLATHATYEIQWGNVQRPTNRNTSWDWARFETCAQKWVDLSEGDYGASLLNDCKYGHDVHGQVMRLSLLRGPTEPDPDADQGEQRFAYSLFPHAGSWDERTIAAAYALNDPWLVYCSERRDAPTRGEGLALFSLDAPNVAIETVKQAEDGQGIILRLYEAMRRRGNATLTCAFEIAAAWKTNLLEENQEGLSPVGKQVSFSVRPYEIITLRLELKRCEESVL